MFDQDNELHTSFIGKWLECESNFNLDTCSNTISHFASSMHICQRLRCTGSRPNGTKKNYNKIDNKIIKNLNSFGYIAVGQGRMASLLLFFSCSSSWPPLAVGQGQMVKVGQAWPRMVKEGQGQVVAVGQGRMAAFLLLSSPAPPALASSTSAWVKVRWSRVTKGDQGRPRMVKDSGSSRGGSVLLLASFFLLLHSVHYSTAPPPWPRSPTLLSPGATLLW